MEPWSELPSSHFVIKVFLDTNILCFYLDKSYPPLDRTLELLSNSSFITLVSSEIALLELAGVRKRQLYLNSILNRFPGRFTPGSVELQELDRDLKACQDFPDLSYAHVREEVAEAVLHEINDLKTSDLKIDFDSNTFHNNLYEVTARLILSCNISRSDGLVLISSLLPAPEEPETHLYLLTKDKDFVAEFENFDLETILGNLGLIKPKIERITSVSLRNGTEISLTNPAQLGNVDQFWREKIKELIVQKNEHLFLGYTHIPYDLTTSPNNCVDFRLKPNTPLAQNLTLTIISNSLDFVYNVKVPVSDFWNNTSINNYPFVNPEVRNISFCSFDYDGDNIVQTSPEIIRRLRETGHLVFVNPYFYE